MREKVKLDFDQQGYDSLKNYAMETGEIILKAKTILNNLEVKCNAKDLIDGEFISRFHKYHKTAHENETDSFAKRLSYEKYIEMLEYDTAPLMELESIYKTRIEKTYEFYPQNDKFYKYCEMRAPRSPFLKDFLDDAPSKVSILLKDLFKISRDKVVVNINEEFFTLYTTNSKQILIINTVRELIKNCEMLGKKVDEVRPLIKEYLVEANILNEKIGLSSDMKTINFNNNKLLTIK